MHSDLKSTSDCKSTGQLLLVCSSEHVPALTADTPRAGPYLCHHWPLVQPSHWNHQLLLPESSLGQMPQAQTLPCIFSAVLCA